MVGLIVAAASTAAPSAEGRPGCLDCRAADEHAAFATFYQEFPQKSESERAKWLKSRE
jgi:hypothetical protein